MTQYVRTLFSHPFSKAYWKDASSQSKSVRILAIAAIFIALKIAFASFFIPVGDNLRVYFSFLITAIQAAVCGPVVAMFCGFFGDLIEFALHPSGPFFIGYSISSLLGALLYALFFYKARITILRIALSKLCVNLFVNVILGSLWSYMLYSKGFLYYLAKSVVKNTVMLPFEIILLVLFFQLILPYLQKQGWISPQKYKRIPWF